MPIGQSCGSSPPLTDLADHLPDNISDQDTASRDSQASRKRCIIFLSLIALSAIISFYWNYSVAVDFSRKSVIAACLGLSHSIGVFILYRNYRHANIRHIHSKALHEIHEIFSLSQRCDPIVIRLLDKIRKIQLISQGYTLAPPGLPPRLATITSQQSSRQTAHMVKMLDELLRPHYQKTVSFLAQIHPLTDQRSITRLKDMYNLEDSPSSLRDVSPENATLSSVVTLDDLDHISHAIRWKRREFVMHFLALDIMTTGHDSERRDYEKNWNRVIQIMTNIKREFKQYLGDLQTLLTTENFDDGLDDDADRHEPIDRRAQLLLNRFSTLENCVKNIQAKLFLCRHDTKALSAGRAALYSMERIHERFQNIDQDITHFIAQWQESQDTLALLSQKEQTHTPHTHLPSPPSSPKEQENAVAPTGSPIPGNKITPSPLQKRRTTGRHPLMTAVRIAAFLDNNHRYRRPSDHNVKQPLEERESVE
ncbi:uncharacterized protein BYT42DRAFT_597049 [Radiomyces spectabilis]|uniref:uncharacterized protein n=1 Tax=Radiomyces spectabilis TaxID=64574 RepID=UPI00221E5544|nr:uncharacterized protein BYT42DRAFT_597049 [Radiomyces spectabilis]KAI8391557.1 hypothetical protein BYT42DRAFT_597049 [Radiomyces spectabilis]